MQTNMAGQQDTRIDRAMTTYGQRLFNFIKRRVPSTTDAEDIMQDVWYQFSKVLSVEQIDQVSSWLFRVARNRLTDQYRKRKPQLLENIQYEGEEHDYWPSEMLLADYTTPETETLRVLFWEELFEALEELPKAQRDVFIANELDNETFREISDRTGINIKTLISRKGYATKFLRTRLASLYDEYINF